MAEGGSKKGRVSLNLTLTLSNVIFLSVCFIMDTTSISLLCVFQGGLSLIQSNLQICEFFKGVIFEK